MNTAALFKISYGLYLLTAKDNNRDNGCIINTASQINSELFCVTVNKQNYTHDIIIKSGALNVSILAQDADFNIFKHFGFQSGRDTDKITGYSGIKRASNGIVYLDNCTNSYICGKVINTVDLGSHTMFIARLTNCEVLNENKSVTYDYYHSNIKQIEKSSEKKGFRCKICGYVYEGDVLPEDFICPICKHGAEDFEII